MSYEIRALGVADAEDYRRVRPEFVAAAPGGVWCRPMTKRPRWIARSSPNVWPRRGSPGSVGSLTAASGRVWRDLQIRSGAKERHKAHLFSMYVDARPSAQRAGRTIGRGGDCRRTRGGRGGAAPFGDGRQCSGATSVSPLGVRGLWRRAALASGRWRIPRRRTDGTEFGFRSGAGQIARHNGRVSSIIIRPVIPVAAVAHGAPIASASHPSATKPTGPAPIHTDSTPSTRLRISGGADR